MLDEIKLVRASWFSSFAANGDLPKDVRRDVFDRGQNALIDKLLLDHPPIVVTLEAEPEEVIAWVCRDFNTLHYVYVKFAFRREGLASRLCLNVRQHTHRTRSGERFLKKIGSLYNPFPLMGV